jgi:hypothetical protein
VKNDYGTELEAWAPNGLEEPMEETLIRVPVLPLFHKERQAYGIVACECISSLISFNQTDTIFNVPWRELRASNDHHTLVFLITYHQRCQHGGYVNFPSRCDT